MPDSIEQSQDTTEQSQTPMANTFTIKRQVQFAETDMAGVLHFSNYLKLMEEVEHAFWRSIGLSVVITQPDGHMSWPRVAVNCDFLAPARFEDEIDLTLNVGSLSSKSITFHITFKRGDDLLAKGQMTAVCCKMYADRFESITIPDDIRRRLAPTNRPPD
jgi:YbgC/YbaW family acyl-CoA thioester hydrolase